MYNPLEYDLVSLERRQRAEAARKYVVRTSELRQRAVRERTPVTARGRDLWTEAVALVRARTGRTHDCDGHAQGAH